MECIKCGSEWKSKVNSEVCPFCGEKLETEVCEILCFNNMPEVLKHIVNTYGLDAYKNTSLLLAYISDLAPQLNSEKRLLKMCAESGVMEQIADSYNIATDERELFLKKATRILCEQYFLNEKASANVLSWISYGIGWIHDSATEDKKEEMIPVAKETHNQDVEEKTVINREQLLNNFVELSDECKELEDKCDSLIQKCDFSRDFGDGIIIEPFNEKKYIELSTEKNYSDAIIEYNKGNYKKAFNLFEKSVSNGNLYALANIGLMLHYGKGCVKNETEAFELFKKGASLGCPLAAAWITEFIRLGKAGQKKDKELAKRIFVIVEPQLTQMCNLGDAQALYFLGYDKIGGVLVKKDINQGIKYIQESYSKGCKSAGIVLGECYFYGTGVPEDDHKAFKLLSENQEEHSMRGKYLLALCYFSGIGTVENESEAFKLFAEAAKGGYGFAKNYLGKCYENGCGTTINYKEAAKWYKDAVDNHSIASAAFLLACLYRDGKGVEKNIELTRKYFLFAAENGDVGAQYIIGMEFLSGEIFLEDKEKGLYWIEKAAEQGNVDAQKDAARLNIAYDEELYASDDKGFRWFLKAANQKDAEAEYSVGMCYAEGVGVKENITEANKWLRKAAGKGHTEACYELGLNYILGNGVEKKEGYGVSLLRKSVANGYDKAKLYLSKKFISDGTEYTEAFNMLNSIDFADDENINLFKIIGEAFYLLGTCYEKGLGCTKDKKKAKEYYQKADSNGYKNPKAKKIFW